MSVQVCMCVSVTCVYARVRCLRHMCKSINTFNKQILKPKQQQQQRQGQLQLAAV